MRALPLALSLLVPCAAAARPSVSLRLGYAPAVGEAAEATPMSDVAVGQLPVQADLLWRFETRAGRLSLGPYASYGLGLAGSCDAGARCTATSVRLGVEGILAFRPARASFDVWAGAGVGYEWTTRRRSHAGSEVERAYRGLEVLSLQGGADLLRRGRIALGPFLLLAAGRYSVLAVDTTVESATRDIAGRRFHAWILVGVRATLDV